MTRLLLVIALACVSLGAHAQQPQPLAPPLQQQLQQPGTRSLQDPTQLTTEALRREIELLSSLIAVELESIKKAQATFEDSITRVPTDVDKQVGQLGNLIEEKLATVEQRFANIESLLEALKASIATADLNRAENIGIALTAQQASVNKAAEGTAEQIRNINAVQQAREASLITAIEGLKDSINDMKDRITQMESRAIGMGEQRSTSQETVVMWVGIAFGVISSAALIIGLLLRNPSIPAPAHPQVVYVQAQPPAPTPKA